jgi:hypothetical protein
MVADYMIWLVSRQNDDGPTHTARLDALVKAFKNSRFDQAQPLPVETE